MKTVKWITGTLLAGAAGIFSYTPALHAQTAGSSAGNNTAGAASTFTSDTTFLRESIHANILDIRMARSAFERASRPAVKGVAREIVADHREILRKMLAEAGDMKLQGVRKSEVDSALAEFDDRGTLSTTDTAAAATTGNTIADSLGSGSSGSGNIGRDDTGTLARARADRRNADYSASGNAYAYRSQRALEQLKDPARTRRRDFEHEWVRLMLQMHGDKIAEYEAAAEQIEDSELKAVVLGAIPRLKLHHTSLLKLRKGKSKAEAIGDDRDGPSEKNSGDPGP